MSFTAFCVASLGLATRLKSRDIVEALFFCSGAFVLVGIVLEVAYGTFHPFTAGYRFAGTQHPNSEGMNCAMLVLSASALADSASSSKFVYRVRIGAQRAMTCSVNATDRPWEAS